MKASYRIERNGQFWERIKAWASLAMLLEYGQKQGVFKGFICQDMALHILLLLDSLETTSSVLDITEEEVDRQFAFLYDLLLVESQDTPSA